MCGIAGGIGGCVTADQASKVAAALHHRGPDDSGIVLDDDAWLLNTRLAIQDLSPAGHQPMRSPDGNLELVFNGELFNHLELREFLAGRGVQFTGHSDTETLLHCWAQFGTACLTELNLKGDFALAVYDRRERELVLVRDRMGVKPLYYYWDGRQFAFASELKVLLLLPGLDLSLDDSVFANYLLYQYNPDERTPFRNIHKLMPSHLLRFGGETVQPEIRRWYTLPFGTALPALTDGDWRAQTADKLRSAVRSQLLSDAPLALTLSGGLDSALVAAFARGARPQQRFTAYCMDTAGAMAAEGFADDAQYAQMVAKHLDLELRMVPADYDLAAEIDAMVYALDEPQADPAAINIRLIARAAREDGNRVLLSGAGADDLFSGYRRHQLLRFMGVLQRLPAGARGLAPLLGPLSAGHPRIRRIAKLLGSAGREPLEAAIHSFFWNEPEAIGGLLLRRPGSLREPYRLFKELLSEIPAGAKLLNQVLFLEQRSFLPHHNLTYMDKLSMAEGVEMRVPFADRELVDLAAMMPVHLKMDGIQTKRVLRDIGAKYLPAAIITRPKTGFGFPLRSWVRGAGREMIRERLLDPSFLSSGIFEPRAVTQFVGQTLAGRQDGAYTLFSLLCIESWLRQFTARS